MKLEKPIEDDIVMTAEKDICLYAASKSDFRAAKKTAELLINHIRENNTPESMAHSDPMYCALHCALVVYYAKPFGKNMPNIQLKSDTIKKHLSPSQRQLHDDLIDIRNKSVAHSDHDKRHTTIYPPGTHGDNQSLYTEITNMGFTPSKIREILALVIHIDAILDSIYLNKLSQLYLDRGKPKEPFKITP